jgi:hypothetical protein
VSTASFDRPIYAVPDIHPLTPTQFRFSTLLLMRATARQALDKAMAVPRSAIRWAIGLFHRWVQATGSAGVLSWLGGQARNAASLIREAGIVPALVAVLSAPPVAAAAVQVAKFAGRGIVRVAKAAWTGIKSLLGRCGVTGVQIVEKLSTTGTKIADAVRWVAKHPLMVPVIHAFKATLALVRPVSRGFVVNRLLAAFVPVLLLRAIIGFLFMPLLVDTNLAGTVWDWATAQPANADPASSYDTRGADNAEGDLLTQTFGSAIPMPGVKDLPSETLQSDVGEQGDDTEQDDEELFLNRAERRAQQREDKRNQRPRR